MKNKNFRELQEIAAKQTLDPQPRPNLEIIIGGGTREALLAQKELFFRKARIRISNSVEFVDDANGNLRKNSPRARAPKKRQWLYYARSAFSPERGCFWKG